MFHVAKTTYNDTTTHINHYRCLLCLRHSILHSFSTGSWFFYPSLGEGISKWGGDVAQMVKSIGLSRRWRRFNSPVPQGIFFPESTFSEVFTHFTCVCTPLCAIACINILAHVKDPVVHGRVPWIMETLKHPACTVGWAVRLSWLAFPRESNLNFPWEKSR